MSVRGGDIYLLYRRRRIKMCGNRLGGGGGTIRNVASVRAIPRVRVTAEWTTHDDRPLRRNTLYT